LTDETPAIYDGMAVAGNDLVMRAPTETHEYEASEQDTLDLTERRIETVTVPVCADTAYELFVRFIGDSQGFLHGQVVPTSDPCARRVCWAAEGRVSGRSTFVPVGDKACLMTCELMVFTGQAADMAERLVSGFREFVTGVSFPF
jgi:hypothetical protein